MAWLKGVSRSEKTKGTISQHLKGKHNSPKTEFKKGHILSEKSRRKISEKQRGRRGRHWKLSEITKRKMQKARIKYMISGQVKSKATQIEVKLEDELKRQGIPYMKQAPVEGIAIVDFLLPNRIIIQADGVYWHSREKRKGRDIVQDTILGFKGYRIYRFTDKEINKSPKRCINKILKERR